MKAAAEGRCTVQSSADLWAGGSGTRDSRGRAAECTAGRVGHPIRSSEALPGRLFASYIRAIGQTACSASRGCARTPERGSTLRPGALRHPHGPCAAMELGTLSASRGLQPLGATRALAGRRLLCSQRPSQGVARRSALRCNAVAEVTEVEKRGEVLGTPLWPAHPPPPPPARCLPLAPGLARGPALAASTLRSLAAVRCAPGARTQLSINRPALACRAALTCLPPARAHRSAPGGGDGG